MIIYRDASVEDMPEVARVHIATQTEYFTSTLGADLLTKFYTEFLNTDHLFVIACDDMTGRIVGFCMGNYYTSDAEKNWEKKYKKQIVGRLFIKCLQFNKLAISRVINRLEGLVTGKKVMRDKYYSHLLSLGVLSEYRGHHIASNMIDEFEQRCLQNAPLSLKGAEKKLCTIGAYKWNTAGCRLYAYKGYTVFAETKEKLKFVKELIADEN